MEQAESNMHWLTSLSCDTACFQVICITTIIINDQTTSISQPKQVSN